MIPWRMRFAGIRDYGPTMLGMEGIDEHIMITGPNGSGKSTITFCMGAVLYSSKVEIEGLKSRNLLPEQIWKASIDLLFYNGGQQKIDAPPYIEFSLKIVQEPGQPIKKEFYISSGDVIDQWESIIKYTSGDRYNNFSAYRKDLQQKYKIDPDLFYLIWYQQEVNQFAVMHPEERFRIFSEMHGINKAQQNWEESMEKVKEAEITLQVADTNVKNHRTNLNLLRTERDRFRDNQKRLREGAQLSIEALLQLEQHYKLEIKRLDELLIELQEDIKEAEEHKAQWLIQLELQKEKLEDYKLEKEQNNESYEQENEVLEKLKTQEEEHLEEKVHLENELEEITEQQKLIRHTEEEVYQLLTALEQKQMETGEQFDQVRGQLQKQEANKQKNDERIAELRHQIERDHKLEAEHQKLLRQYESSHNVQRTIKQLEEAIEEHKNEKYEKTRMLNELQAEKQLLLEKRDLSKRQQESLSFFRSRNIKAYPLRELLELDAVADVKLENRFNAVKYTVFFEGKETTPPNDLYHVPLMNIIPEMYVNEIPELQVRVREQLSAELQPQALKALWWLQQFFHEKEVYIKDDVLYDSMGLRGPQERDKYILSEKAMFVRKQEVNKQIGLIVNRLEEISQLISNKTIHLQQLNSVIQRVKEAEAFITNLLEREQRVNDLQTELQRQQLLKDSKAELENQREQLLRLQIEQEQQHKQLQLEKEFYVKLGNRKEQYERLMKFKAELELIKQKINYSGNQLEILERQISHFDRKMKAEQKHIEDTEGQITGVQKNINSIERQARDCKEELDLTQQELIIMIGQLEELKAVIPELYEEFSSHYVAMDKFSERILKQQLQNGEIRFNSARTESNIDPAAEENFEKAEEEYNRLHREFQQSQILLESDKERTEQLKDQLETTINMRVLEIQKRFTAYMSQFQFQGEISWDSHEDKKGRTHFELFIKARKEGHRGTMEDVSIKARGGRVGKGVSGGEESLSSLLFALALLQNLEISPGFIVLDEFDSALDEERKSKVFDLYVHELKRKLIILTPKSHEEAYINRFRKAFIIDHNPAIPKSKVIGVKMK
ncbi:AAA family ATPase [Bacillus sp. AGMB 02131]|uniref:AAA family ATPase n=1 Tax=Peribacillus faecalis TaxID=2772559 RepID=A0A927CX58_9BACI|nr:AAA family ATPase [Peribacillus faecalis]MBD3109273.1 AAA family ATPase [Peribacillus faecalis]